VPKADELCLASRDARGQQGHFAQELRHDQPDVRPHCIVDDVARLATDLGDGWSDGLDETGEVRVWGTSSLRRAHRGLHRAAALVAENRHQGNLQLHEAVLDAAEHGGIDDVPGRPDHEQVSESLVEDDLRRDARVSAAENERERMLTGGDDRSPPRILVQVERPILDEALVPLEERSDGFLRSGGPRRLS